MCWSMMWMKVFCFREKPIPVSCVDEAVSVAVPSHFSCGEDANVVTGREGVGRLAEGEQWRTFIEQQHGDWSLRVGLIAAKSLERAKGGD